MKWTPYLATYNGDDDIYLTSSVLSLGTSEMIKSKVVLLGDSSFREAIYEDRLQASLDLENMSLQVLDLRTGGQTLLETLAIVDALPDSENSLLVIGISIRKFIITDDAVEYALNGTRRGFTSEAVDIQLGETGVNARRKSGMYGLDNFRFLAPRFIDYIQRPFSEPIRRVKHQSSVKKAPDRKTLERLEQQYLNRINLTKNDYLLQVESGKKIFEKIHTIGSMKGYRFLVIETPLNPDFIENRLPDDFFQFYLADSSNFHSRYSDNLDYFNPLFELNLVSEHFRDLNHLRVEDAILSYTKSVGEEIFRTINPRAIDGK